MAQKIKNIALKSAAGSGKTHALTKRFLMLYLHDHGFPLESLYAITFTKAAAFEMKNRIFIYLDALVKGVSEKEAEQDVIEYFSAMFPDIQARARARKDHLLNNFSDVHISTFHSLFASFLSCIPFSAGIMPDYEIIEETDEHLILEQVIDDFLEAVYRDPKGLNMLSDLLEQQEHMLKQGIDRIYKDLVPWVPYLIQLVEREDEIRHEHERLSARLIKRLEEFNSFVRDNEYAAVTKKGNINSNIEGLLCKIDDFIKDGGLRKLDPVLAYFLEDGIMSKTHFRNFASRLKGPDGFQRLVEDVEHCCNKCALVLSEREILIHLKPIIAIDKRFRKAKQMQSVLSFDDIEFFTRQALTSSPETDYLYFKLGSEMNHLMIDEFQDTSYRQVDILEPIINEITAVSPESKSLFYVGDPSQAIFRWREGAPELFDYLKEKYRGKIAGDRLSVNFRTREEIISFINRILDKDDKPKSGNGGGWIRIEDLGELNSKSEGVEASINKTVFVVKELINDKGYVPDDIAVLTRTNDFAAKLARALSEEGIPYVSRSRASVLDEPDIQFMLHLLRFLDNPEDDFSLIHVLLSPAVRMNEETVRHLMAAGKKTVYIALKDLHSDWPVTSRLEKLLSQVYFNNPYEVICRILQTFELRISYPLATLLDVALKYTNKGFNSLNSFIGWFEEHRAAIEVKEIHSRGVEILTVHRAKGLEFEIVIIPETNHAGQYENRQLLFSYQKDNARPDKVYWRRYGQYLPDLQEAEKERLEKDSLNLLYVALTRAKSGVYMLGYTTRRSRGGSWLDAIRQKLGDEPLPYYEIPKREKPQVEEKEAKPYRVTTEEKGTRVREERTLYSPTERGVEIIAPERRRGMEFGEMIHRALSQVEWLDEVDIEKHIAEAVEYTKNMFARSTDDESDIEARLAPLFREAISDPDLRFLFYRDDRDVACKNELPIYFEEEKRDISAHIDRLIVGSDEVIIADYKTGGEKEEYKKQINVYKKGIQKIYPGRRIRTLLVYLEKARGSKIVEV